ncbi:MAG: hypothetical protein ACETWQ_17365 [Phycisphaerae bacterium]
MMIDFAAGGVCPERITLPAFVGTGRAVSDGFNYDTTIVSPPTAVIHNDYFAVVAAPGQGRLPILFEAVEKQCNSSTDFT